MGDRKITQFTSKWSHIDKIMHEFKFMRESLYQINRGLKRIEKEFEDALNEIKNGDEKMRYDEEKKPEVEQPKEQPAEQPQPEAQPEAPAEAA